MKKLQTVDAVRTELRRMNQSGGTLAKAARLYTDFSGRERLNVGKIKVPARPKILLSVGKIDGILYSAERDGRVEKYIHRFRRKSRPLLLVSPDGKQLVLLGGAYNFTERGIVDS